MAVVRIWHRDLHPAERRISFKVLEEQWDTAESIFVTNLSEAVKKMFERLLTDVTTILEKKDYNFLLVLIF